MNIKENYYFHKPASHHFSVLKSSIYIFPENNQNSRKLFRFAHFNFQREPSKNNGSTTVQFVCVCACVFDVDSLFNIAQQSSRIRVTIHNWITLRQFFLYFLKNLSASFCSFAYSMCLYHVIAFTLSSTLCINIEIMCMSTNENNKVYMFSWAYVSVIEYFF